MRLAGLQALLMVDQDGDLRICAVGGFEKEDIPDPVCCFVFLSSNAICCGALPAAYDSLALLSTSDQRFADELTRRQDPVAKKT